MLIFLEGWKASIRKLPCTLMFNALQSDLFIYELLYNYKVLQVQLFVSECLPMRSFQKLYNVEDVFFQTDVHSIIALC